MSKAGAIAAMGIGGSGAALTTAYFAGVFDGNYDVELYSKLDDFTNKDKEVEGCVLSLFPGLKNKQEDKNLHEPTSTAIGSGFFDKNEGISSCLVVNWEKYKQQTGTGWRGDFRFLWTVKQEKENETGESKKKGFVVFAKASTEVDTSGGSTKQLNWEGIIYEIGRSSDGTKWEKKSKQEIKESSKKQQKNDLDSKFPKANNKLKGIEGNDKSFWGLMTEKGDIDNIFSKADGEQLSGSFKGYWEWTSGGGEEKLEDWTTGLDTWWDGLFKKDKWDMPNVVKDKQGTWVNKAIENNTPTPKPTAS